jgi:hypothetical protein
MSLEAERLLNRTKQQVHVEGLRQASVKPRRLATPLETFSIAASAGDAENAPGCFDEELCGVVLMA